MEGTVASLVVKYYTDTGRVLIGNAKYLEIRTFYINDGSTSNPFEDAVKMAESLVK